MWLSAEKYADLKAKADRADDAETRLKASEDRREAERETHFQHTLQLTNQLLVACGRWPIKDEPPKAADTPVPPLPAAILEDAKEVFIEDFTEAGMSMDEAVEAFERYRLTGEMPYERQTEAEN